MVRVLLWTVGAFVAMALIAFAVVPQMVGRRMNRTLDGASGPVSAEALHLQETLDVVDLHSDALLWNRDLTRRGSWGHVDVPRLIEGRTAVQAFTAVTRTPRRMNIDANAVGSDNITLLAVLERWPVRTWGSLTERALWQAEKLGDVAANSGGRLAILRTKQDLATFRALHEEEPGTVAGFLGVEGLHALEGDLANVDRLYAAGFRLFGLTHFFDNEVGGSAHGMAKGGLTDFGRQVVVRAESLGILIDLAHASPALIDDVLRVATRPVVVSHTGVKGTCDNPRNLDDRQLAGIAATGGVVGIGLWETALCGTTPPDWARAVRHAVDVAGVEHVGLGSDWDGAVTAMIDASGTVHLTQALLDAGFTEAAIRSIMGGNALRLLGESLPSEAEASRR